ncbi:HAMP domain [Micromonospora haikouensis]|uniref:HAMP domain n=1 Tax=Micromonospora haikouensis TaxID=686309 RepID=A0A1C4V5P1_9ACTN|nr:HAMP domain [Micromonospora haikouensis]
MVERSAARHEGAAPHTPPGPVTDPGLRQLLAGLTAVRDGDFGTRLPEDGDGLLGEIATVFNGMVDQLSLFTSEVTRVAREVGTEGQLGGQAEVPGVSGTWKDLTDSVNAMAGNPSPTRSATSPRWRRRWRGATCRRRSPWTCAARSWS